MSPRTDENRPLPMRTTSAVTATRPKTPARAVQPERPHQVNVRADTGLHDDLDKIARATNIRNRSDVIRYAVAQTARRIKGGAA